MIRLVHGLSVGIAAAALALPFAAVAAPQSGATRSCFFVRNWDGWSAPDGDTLLLRVGLRDVYRVELTPKSHVRKRGDTFLVNRVRGSNTICSAVDLQLSLADHHGFEQPLIARSIVKLTPSEIAAIPKKHVP